MSAQAKPLYQQPPPESPAPSRAFKTFEDLEAYKAAREFRKAIYAAGGQLPEIEKYGLTNQIRRAAVSLTNNIAEGHGRYHYLEQIKFCLQARGSLEELLDDLNVCEDERYLPTAAIAALRQQAWRVHQLLNGYIRWLRQRKQGSTLPLHETSPTYRMKEDDLAAVLDAPLVEVPPPASTLQRLNASTPS